MKIVLTGGTGLLGGRLGQELVRSGHAVTALVRDPARAGLSFPAEVVQWRGDSEYPPASALKGADAVIHLAGESIAGARWSEKRKADLISSRVRSTENLSKVMKDASLRAKVYISASATGIYGDCKDTWLTEQSQPGSDFLAKLCVDWEQAADQVPADRCVKLRFGVVLSPQGGFLRQVAPLFTTVGASRLGSGAQYMPWIHIDDAVAAILWSLNKESLKGVLNAVAPEAVTNAQVTEQLAEKLGAFFGPPVPGFALKLLYGELAQALLGSQRVRPEALQNSAFQFRFKDLNAALADLYDELRPGEMKLIFNQWVPSSIKEVWPFFTAETNLEKITPPFLNFKVVGKSTPEIQKGTLIDYRLRIHGVPAGWQSLISVWEVEREFVDEQVKGPYSRWHHWHGFEPLGSGTLLRDVIHLKVPFFWPGRLVAQSFVLKDVEAIFAYRSQVIREVFSTK